MGGLFFDTPFIRIFLQLVPLQKRFSKDASLRELLMQTVTGEIHLLELISSVHSFMTFNGDGASTVKQSLVRGLLTNASFPLLRMSVPV